MCAQRLSGPFRRLAGAAAAVLGLSVNSLAAGGERVTVVDVAGSETAGMLHGLTAAELTIAGDTPKRWELDDLLTVRFAGRERGGLENGPVVWPANGDRLFVQPESLDEDSLVGVWKGFPAWPRVTIPLEQVRALALDLPENAEARRRLTAELLEFDGDHDALFLKNGDRLRGRLLGLSADAVSFESPVGKVEIPRANLRAIAFNAELLNPPDDDDDRRVLLELSDGSRLTARTAVLKEAGLLEVDGPFGAKLSVTTAAVASLRFLGGRATYLSDMKEAEYRFTPYLSTRWPLRRDRNVLGGPLRLRGREFAKGLGMHSRSAVSYDLAGKYRQFRATVGIDDSALGRGSVRFAVEADGRRVFTSEPVTGEDEPVTLGPLDVGGVKRLTLIVEFGELGDILDRANWCDAVVIR